MSEFKQPGERLVYAYDFTAKLAGQTIATIESVTAAPREAEAPGADTLDEVTRTDDGSVVRVEWQAGEDGSTYLTTVTVTDDADQIHEIDGEIIVADLSFTLPTGITSTYLTGEEYVARFGIDETVMLTDHRGTQTVGGALGTALIEAASLANGYIGARYSLPLTDTPEALKGIVADIARERLHTLHPTDEVTARADRARSTLKDISSGKFELVIDDELVADGSADEPVIYAPDQIFTDDRLNSYRGMMQ